MATITLKTPEQIELITKAAVILSDCLSFLSSRVQPGVTGLEIDKLGDDFVQSFGATAACKGYDGFPNGMCISVNSGAVHCVPNNTPFRPGDVIKLDMVVDYKGWKADSAITVLIPPVTPEIRTLTENTYSAMRDGIRAALEGNTVQDVSRAIYAARNESGVIQPFTGHGIGSSIHEAPGIPNYVAPEKNALIVAGMVLCIEPIFCIGDPAIYHQKGQWNTWMLSGKVAAHFEHTILVNPAGQPPTILTLRNNETI